MKLKLAKWARDIKQAGEATSSMNFERFQKVNPGTYSPKVLQDANLEKAKIQKNVRKYSGSFVQTRCTDNSQLAFTNLFWLKGIIVHSR